MMYDEFVKLTGKECSHEDFEKFEEMYMASRMDKYEFCEFIKPAVKAEKKEPNPILLRMYSDYRYYPIEDKYYKIYELVDINIAKGKRVVKDTGRIERWLNCYELEQIREEDVIIRKSRKSEDC